MQIRPCLYFRSCTPEHCRVNLVRSHNALLQRKTDMQMHISKHFYMCLIPFCLFFVSTSLLVKPKYNYIILNNGKFQAAPS